MQIPDRASSHPPRRDSRYPFGIFRTLRKRAPGATSWPPHGSFSGVGTSRRGEGRAGQGRGADPRRDIHRSHPSAGIRGKGAGISIGALTALTGGAAAVNTHYPPLNDTGLGEPGKRKKNSGGRAGIKSGEKKRPRNNKRNSCDPGININY